MSIEAPLPKALYISLVSGALEKQRVAERALRRIDSGLWRLVPKAWKLKARARREIALAEATDLLSRIDKKNPFAASVAFAHAN